MTKEDQVRLHQSFFKDKQKIDNYFSYLLRFVSTDHLSKELSEEQKLILKLYEMEMNRLQDQYNMKIDYYGTI